MWDQGGCNEDGESTKFDNRLDVGLKCKKGTLLLSFGLSNELHSCEKSRVS